MSLKVIAVNQDFQPIETPNNFVDLGLGLASHVFHLKFLLTNLTSSFLSINLRYKDYKCYFVTDVTLNTTTNIPMILLQSLKVNELTLQPGAASYVSVFIPYLQNNISDKELLLEDDEDIPSDEEEDTPLAQRFPDLGQLFEASLFFNDVVYLLRGVFYRSRVAFSEVKKDMGNFYENQTFDYEIDVRSMIPLDSSYFLTIETSENIFASVIINDSIDISSDIIKFSPMEIKHIQLSIKCSHIGESHLRLTLKSKNSAFCCHSCQFSVIDLQENLNLLLTDEDDKILEKFHFNNLFLQSFFSKPNFTSKAFKLINSTSRNMEVRFKLIKNDGSPINSNECYISTEFNSKTSLQNLKPHSTIQLNMVYCPLLKKSEDHPHRMHVKSFKLLLEVSSNDSNTKNTSLHKYLETYSAVDTQNNLNSVKTISVPCRASVCISRVVFPSSDVEIFKRSSELAKHLFTKFNKVLKDDGENNFSIEGLNDRGYRSKRYAYISGLRKDEKKTVTFYVKSKSDIRTVVRIINPHSNIKSKSESYTIDKNAIVRVSLEFTLIEYGVKVFELKLLNENNPMNELSLFILQDVYEHEDSVPFAFYSVREVLDSPILQTQPLLEVCQAEYKQTQYDFGDLRLGLPSVEPIHLANISKNVQYLNFTKSSGELRCFTFNSLFVHKPKIKTLLEVVTQIDSIVTYKRKKQRISVPRIVDFLDLAVPTDRIINILEDQYMPKTPGYLLSFYHKNASDHIIDQVMPFLEGLSDVHKQFFKTLIHRMFDLPTPEKLSVKQRLSFKLLRVLALSLLVESGLLIELNEHSILKVLPESTVSMFIIAFPASEQTGDFKQSIKVQSYQPTSAEFTIAHRKNTNVFPMSSLIHDLTLSQSIHLEFTGSIIKTSLFLQQKTLNLGNVPMKCTVSKQLIIQNEGTVESFLYLTVRNDDSGLSHASKSLSFENSFLQIKPNHSESAVIMFNSSEIGKMSCNVEILDMLNCENFLFKSLDKLIFSQENMLFDNKNKTFDLRAYYDHGRKLNNIELMVYSLVNFDSNSSDVFLKQFINTHNQEFDFDKYSVGFNVFSNIKKILVKIKAKVIKRDDLIIRPGVLDFTTSPLRMYSKEEFESEKLFYRLKNLDLNNDVDDMIAETLQFNMKPRTENIFLRSIKFKTILCNKSQVKYNIKLSLLQSVNQGESSWDSVTGTLMEDGFFYTFREKNEENEAVVDMNSETNRDGNFEQINRKVKIAIRKRTDELRTGKKLKGEKKIKKCKKRINAFVTERPRDIKNEVFLKSYTQAQSIKLNGWSGIELTLYLNVTIMLYEMCMRNDHDLIQRILTSNEDVVYDFCLRLNSNYSISYIPCTITFFREEIASSLGDIDTVEGFMKFLQDKFLLPENFDDDDDSISKSFSVRSSRRSSTTIKNTAMMLSPRHNSPGTVTTIDNTLPPFLTDLPLPSEQDFFSKPTTPIPAAIDLPFDHFTPSNFTKLYNAFISTIQKTREQNLFGDSVIFNEKEHSNISEWVSFKQVSRNDDLSAFIVSSHVNDNSSLIYALDCSLNTSASRDNSNIFRIRIQNISENVQNVFLHSVIKDLRFNNCNINSALDGLMKHERLEYLRELSILDASNFRIRIVNYFTERINPHWVQSLDSGVLTPGLVIEPQSSVDVLCQLVFDIHDMQRQDTTMMLASQSFWPLTTQIGKITRQYVKLIELNIDIVLRNAEDQHRFCHFPLKLRDSKYLVEHYPLTMKVSGYRHNYELVVHFVNNGTEMQTIEFKYQPWVKGDTSIDLKPEERKRIVFTIDSLFYNENHSIIEEFSMVDDFRMFTSLTNRFIRLNGDKNADSIQYRIKNSKISASIPVHLDYNLDRGFIIQRESSQYIPFEELAREEDDFVIKLRLSDSGTFKANLILCSDVDYCQYLNLHTRQCRVSEELVFLRPFEKLMFEIKSVGGADYSGFINITSHPSPYLPPCCETLIRVIV
ncbi:hypothetical protein PCE1_003597 [Barthelona sp. PCE]